MKRWLRRWRQRRRMRRVVRAMILLRRAGACSHRATWLLDARDGAVADAEGTAERVTGWLRAVLGRSRRPHGIDRFDLDVTCAAVVGGALERRLSLADLRPAALYAGDLPECIARLLADAHRPAQRPVALTVSLFSWGEAAHQAFTLVGGPVR